MMWGNGGDGYGMGPGMMSGGGYPGARIPNLTSEQARKMADIQKDFRQKQWQLMEKMHDLRFQQGGFYRGGKFDERAARSAYEASAGLHKQMFDNWIEEQKRIDGILMPEQREQMQRYWGGQ
jgi:Spy/CpxP family protein refolding chaperone